MSRSKHIDVICAVVLALTLALTLIFMNGGSLGIQAKTVTLGYEDKLFDDSYVHTIDIEMDDWDDFLSTATSETYTDCNLTIDGESFDNVAIRGKGNTSLSSVAAYGNDRYSFKVEFDHYSDALTYYGLDKLSLNNLIQDNTYMKDYLTYTMMAEMGVPAPLVSYVNITVNGEAWGLYLAVEGVEDSFLERNYGSESGNLYKPDSTSMGGGRGNGGNFDLEDFQDQFNSSDHSDDTNQTASDSTTDSSTTSDSLPQDSGNAPDNRTDSSSGDSSDSSSSASLALPDGPDSSFSGNSGNMGGSMSSSDVSLQYIDDDPDSYSNIFNNAKTDITEVDEERLISSLKQLSEGENISEVVDTDEVLRYLVVHDFVDNGDSYTGSMVHNYYLYEEDGQLSMIPWDYNLAFGSFSMGGMSGTATSDSATSAVNSPIDTPVTSGDISSRPMVAWIFNDESYTKQYHELYAQFISDYFDSGKFASDFDAVVAMISPYVENDPTAFCTYDEFTQGAATLKEFCLLRAESVKGQLDGSIPSTEDGQSADSSALIDASAISISDMGSMSSGMGGDMTSGSFSFPGGSNFPSDGSFPDSSDFANGGSLPGNGGADSSTAAGSGTGGSSSDAGDDTGGSTADKTAITQTSAGLAAGKLQLLAAADSSTNSTDSNAVPDSAAGGQNQADNRGGTPPDGSMPSMPADNQAAGAADGQNSAGTAVTDASGSSGETAADNTNSSGQDSQENSSASQDTDSSQNTDSGRQQMGPGGNFSGNFSGYFSGGNFSPDSSSSTGSDSSSDTATVSPFRILILLGASILVLLLGLLFAIRYRSRN
ncbi:spore coat protein CotH [Oscillospiraceae bacterium HV4-5-C5C]|nr:spore coat protein CotH [Oscillospiraceae bacterium HV4-5-C5C]